MEKSKSKPIPVCIFWKTSYCVLCRGFGIYDKKGDERGIFQMFHKIEWVLWISRQYSKRLAILQIGFRSSHFAIWPIILQICGIRERTVTDLSGRLLIFKNFWLMLWKLLIALSYQSETITISFWYIRNLTRRFISRSNDGTEGVCRCLS